MFGTIPLLIARHLVLSTSSTEVVENTLPNCSECGAFLVSRDRLVTTQIPFSLSKISLMPPKRRKESRIQAAERRHREKEAEEDTLGKKSGPIPSLWIPRHLPREADTRPSGYRLIDMTYLLEIVKSALSCKNCQ